MKTFYKLNQDGTVATGSGTKTPLGFIEYTKGQEPQELKVALDAQAQVQAIQKINNDIFVKLDAIDTKSIRAFRENDVTRLAVLENEAKALRLQIVAV